MGRAGNLKINIVDTRLENGERVPLRAIKNANGRSHVGVLTGAIVATGIVFSPAAPLLLFVKGNNIEIPKCTAVAAYVNGDLSIDPATLTNDPAATSGKETPSTEKVSVVSNPIGADALINGGLVGKTPVAINLPSGIYALQVRKKGYKVWKHTVPVCDSPVNLNVELGSL